MVTFLTAAEAKSRLEEFDVIIDVRSQGEWESGHLTLPSVRHIENLHSSPEKAAALTDIANKKILIHCGKGGRASRCEYLKSNFSNLSIVNEGGYAQLC